MHYLIEIITKEFPTNRIIQKIMAPYNEDDYYENNDKNKVRPPILWDSWGIGGRYNGILKLRAEYSEDDETEYHWGFYSKKPRAGRLFRCQLFEMLYNDPPKLFFREEDFYPYFGYRDGYLRVDGCRIKDCINFEDVVCNHGYALIDFDQNLYTRDQFKDDSQYEENIKSVIQSNDLNDYYICIVDIHW